MDSQAWDGVRGKRVVMTGATNGIGLAAATFSFTYPNYGSDERHDHCPWVGFFFTTCEARFSPSFEGE